VALAGKGALVKVTGASVAFSSETMITSDNLTYTLSSSLQNEPWDPTANITITTSSGGTVSGYTTNRLKGEITFSSSASRTLKASGEYRTLSTLAKAKEVNINLVTNLFDVPYFGVDAIPRIRTLESVNGTLGKWYDTDRYFYDVVSSTSEPNPLLLEFYAASTSSYTLRTWIMANADEIASVIDGSVEDTLSFESTPDTDDRLYTFNT